MVILNILNNFEKNKNKKKMRKEREKENCRLSTEVF